MKTKLALSLLLLFIYTLPAYSTQAVISKITGKAQILILNQQEWQAAEVKMILKSGDRIKTESGSSVVLTTIQGDSINVSENSNIEISTLNENLSEIKLFKGRLKAKVKGLEPGERFEIKTPNATCAVRGTSFSVSFKNNITQIAVFQGMVAAKELITGQSVIVKPGKYSSISAGKPPTQPRDFKKTKSDEGKKVKPDKEDTFAKAKKEIFQEISKQQVLDQAAQDVKNAEYQNGKALIDAYGKRIRLEEYIMRPQADQFKYVVLNKRENRFDFGKILFTFNKDLPENLSDATQYMFQKEDEAPNWYPTDVLSVISNTQDTVTEIAAGGHPETTSSGGKIYYNTLFDQYDFYANDTRLWGYNKTAFPETSYYHGGVEPTSLWVQPDGSTIFHFIAKDTYSDGTWIQAEDFIIDNDGNVINFSDIIDPSNINADEIRSKVLEFNFQRVYTSSLFGNRKIDLVYSSKLLSDAGILNLPSSLGAPSVVSGSRDSGFDYSKPAGGFLRVARLRESGGPDELPEPIMPYGDEIVPDVEEKAESGAIKQFLSAEMLGGQYYVDGVNTDLKGNMDLIYVPVINFSENTALLPIYTGQYRGTKDVKDLIGGGTLVQESMNHSLYLKGIHKTASEFTYKGTLGFSGEWLAETKDETLSDGLFNNYRYTAGFSAEKPFFGWNCKVGYDFSLTDYVNYEALSSDNRFADAGVTDSMGTDVLDFQSHDISFGIEIPINNQIKLKSDYVVSYLSFGDQKIIERSGNYASAKRNDLENTLNISGIVDTKNARMALGYGLQYYVSNQNAYDANRTYFSEDYYDYIEQKITPSISFFLNKNRSSSLSLYWDFTFLKYLARKTQNINGDYGTSNIGQITTGFGLWFKYPLYRQLSLKMKMNYLMSSSNMKYESVYNYNYDVVNYFIGFGWEM